MNIKEFLQETKFCDFNHPSIKVIALDFKTRYEGKSRTELAVALFYFVRDYTNYKVGNWRKTASQTLAEKGGTCTNNSNLLVALCRAVGIPAGYGILEVVGPDYFGPIALPALARVVSKRTKHIYCCVYLSGRWIKCDPSDDETLSINTQHLNPQSTLVEWNGISDAILKLHPSHILSDSWPLSNIDHVINKKQRKKLYFPVRIANLYIDFLRKHGSKVSSIEMLEPKFLEWLKASHFVYYLFYSLLIKYFFAKESKK